MIGGSSPDGGNVDYDVVVVGASIAGCTAAMLYGRAGLRVALLEKHRSANSFKALCGHFVLGGTEELLRRTGLWPELVAAGGVPARVALWNGSAWLTPPETPIAEPASRTPGPLPVPISLRRERLDPLLRRLAAETPGVDLLLGHRAVGLVAAAGRIVGVRTRTGDGAEHEHRGRLVVGADGYRSTVADLAGVPRRETGNNRFGMWAYYRGVVGRAPGDSQIWRLGGEWARDTAIAVSTDDDLTMLVSFPTKARLAEFGDDRVAALERTFAAVTDPPDLSGAERVSKVIGMTDYPCVRRDPTPAPGLYLVGDAAVTGDPLPAVGCGWAFRAADWLVEATVPELRGQASSGAARRAYRRSLRFLLRHDRLARRAALAGPPDPVQRAVLRAAVLDPEIGRRSYLFAMRAAPVSALINPVTIGRALAVSARGRPAVTAASTR